MVQIAQRDRFRHDDAAPDFWFDPGQLDPQLQQIGNLLGLRLLQGGTGLISGGFLLGGCLSGIEIPGQQFIDPGNWVFGNP